MSAFSSRFDLTTGNARITVESDNQYWGEGALADPARADLVRLTDDMDAHMLLEPSEALALAAALQAVAVHLMEDEGPRDGCNHLRAVPSQPLARE